VSIVSPETSIESLVLQGNKSLRIEEIPVKEVSLSENEMLVTVAHFHQVCVPTQC